MKVILFNGPPRCGKDTAARLLHDPLLDKTVIERFSRPIKRAFAGFINRPIDDWDNVDYYEANKEKPLLDFHSDASSYRDWQIAFSERLIKPMLGDEAFARLLVRRLAAIPDRGRPNTVLIPDCGFQAELNYLSYVRHMDLQVVLLRIHRAGTSFANDSRSYLTHPDAIDIHNDSTLEVFHSDLKRALA